MQYSCTDGERKVWHFTWPSEEVDYAAYKQLVLYFSKPNYAPVDLKKLSVKLKKINKRFASNLTNDQGLSIHHMVIKEKIIKGHARMNSKIMEISTKYNDGEDIIKLSIEYDLPPLNLLRGIFLHNGLKTDLFRDLNPRDLVGRNLLQFKKALKNDADTVINAQEIARLAQHNEDLFIKYFLDIGVKLQTQEQLVQLQTLQYGRAIITPDILFIDIVYINGIKVNWIDFKSYMQTDVGFIYNSNLSQSARYATAFGMGAVCFQLGLVKSIALNGAIALNGSLLNNKINFVNNLYI